ncbi:hypothetical protein [Polaribacter sp. IC073]|uniref:hypothetical protein n=1 Tax=Polaribacter sp. IC073 TaxID=2508540 RepID=UPI0011BE6917|nr:hypothetical protein [Polaribacter sp. IC073]TXD45903.1 hypothetical protein ES045_15880 [Polaribacter sp. IC073]
MKEILLKFINNYDKEITINKDKVDYIQYENKEQIYIDLDKKDLSLFLSNLNIDFEIEETISNLEDGFLVYEFNIPNDIVIGQADYGDGIINDLFTVETSVYLTTRDYKRVYRSYLNSKKWHDKRNEMLKFSDYKCSRCSKTENLQVHHLNYNTIGDESLGDLDVVCVGCHKKIHNIN